MSASFALQRAVYELLVASPEVGAIVGDRIYDGPPTGAAFPYVSFGPSDASSDDVECITATVEALQVDCWTREGNRLGPCRKLVGAVKAAIHGAAPDLGDYAALRLDVTSTRAFMDEDGLTAHGVAVVEATVEEPAHS